MMQTYHAQYDQVQSSSTAATWARRPRASFDKTEEDTLIRRLTNHDDQAFETLYTRHAPSIRAYLQRRLRDEDIVYEVLDDVMMVLWRDAAQIPPSVPLAAWLFGIARRQMLKAWNRAARCDPPAPEGAEDSTLTTPEHDLLRQEHYVLVSRFLNRLPSDQRELMELAIFQGLTYEEISCQTHINVNTIKSRLTRVRRRLSDYMSAQG